MAVSQQNNLQLQSRWYESDQATTSGRQDTNSTPATVVPIFWGDFISRSDSQSFETDALVCLQNQMRCLQSGMEMLRKKHYRELQSVVENETVKRRRVKEVELETVKQKNKELEEQLMQKSAECQVWFDYARTTEAMVFSLRKKHDQALTNKSTCPTIEIEGYGESSGDAESVCESDKENGVLSWRACWLCRERAVCVLLLPCRHLCLCKECEARVDTCPVCNSPRNASIQVVVPSYLA